MGPFSSREIPQPPLPDLTIHLDDAEHRVYKPDDVVRGQVVLKPFAFIEPEALEVSLFGQSLIWYRASTTSRNFDDSITTSTYYHHWRDNAPLFEDFQDVLHAGTTSSKEEEKGKSEATWRFEAGQTYTFPFQFTFPTQTSNARYGQYKNDLDKKYDIGPHNLPPTFLLTSSYNLKDSGTDANFAKIEYGIRARLVCPGVGIVQGKTLADLTTTSTILFQPTCHIPPFGPHTVLRRYPKSFTLQSSILSGKPASQIGFRQSIRDRYSSSTPKLFFEVALEIPEQFTSGSEFRFRTSLTTLSKTSNAVHIPPSVTLTVLEASLLDFTFYRALYDSDASSPEDGKHWSNRYESWPSPDQMYVKGKYEHEEYTERKTPLNALPESVTLELDTALPEYGVLAGSKETHNGVKEELQVRRACEQWFTARIPGATVPSFRSFAITRAYKVRVKLGVEVGGKKFEMQAESAVGSMGSGHVS
jgi:hypothetical protein